MGQFGFSESEIIPFFASLTRVATLFMVLPFFGDNNIPPLVKIFLAFTINLMLFPIAVSNGLAHVKADSISDMGLVALVFKEAAVGFVLGFTARIFFDGLTFAFAHMGNQMGFNMANAYDHSTETNMPVISQMIMIFATLLFLAMDGHHFFLKALVQSYNTVPIGGFVLTKSVASFVIETTTQVFLIAAKLSAPMALLIFLINCAFGVVAKAVPQINVFVVSFTVNILCGFFVISLTMPLFGTSLGEIFEMMANRVHSLMHYLV